MITLAYYEGEEMSKFPVTVCIIAKNEEKHIENCLKHLLPYGFETIVTDTGSTDRTVELAKKYADKVVEFEWIDDFSAARNYCASFASNNWIIALDCDEYMENIDLRILRILMQKFHDMVGTIRLKNLIINDDGSKGYGGDDVIRMYNKKYYHFKNPIHEQLVSIDPAKENEVLRCFLMPTEVIHHGYALSKEEMDLKQERNLRLLAKELEANPDDSYPNFQYGQSLLVMEKFEEAIPYFEKGMENQPGLDRIFVQIMLTSLAKCYNRVGRGDEALALLQKYEGECKSAKFLFSYATAYYDMKQYLKSLMMYLKTISCADADMLGENLLDSYRHIISIYMAMNKPDMADMFKEKLAKLEEDKKRITGENDNDSDKYRTEDNLDNTMLQL